MSIRRMILHRLALPAFLLSFCTILNAQERHSLNLELGGRTLLFGSLNYEYQILDKVSIGGGLGVINLSRGQITRDNGGMDETGNYLDISTSQMLYGNYFMGRNKHKMLLTAGLTNFLQTYRNTYPSETVIGRDLQVQWNAGLGYQFTGKQNYFRLTGYVLKMPQPSGWFPPYIPWFGLTTGRTFKSSS